MARKDHNHASVEERRAARAAEKKYGDKVRRRKQANPKKLKPRKPIRWKWRTVAKREIRREIKNSSKKPAIPRAAIERLIREYAPGFQFEQDAMAQLRAAAEAHVVNALEAARFVADGEGVPTLDARHMHVVAAITNKMTTPTPLPEEYTIERRKAVHTSVAEPTVEIGAPPEAEVDAASPGDTDMFD